jgi:AcrB/AcrD/AcrF family
MLSADPDDFDRLHIGGCAAADRDRRGFCKQQSLGTVVFGGMLASTLLAIPFVPVFYIVMQGVGERLGGRARLASRSLKFPEKAPEMDGSRTHRLP